VSVRSFVDSAGHEWLAFDVVPRSEERRRYDRRTSGETRLEDSERRDSDRRITVGGTRGITGAAGWLCFECGRERRRLWPIPAAWTRATDETLESYWRSARPVPRTTPAGERGAADEGRPHPPRRA